MRVLVTGSTALQVNSPFRPIQKIDVPAIMVDELRKLKHDVDWRKVELGASLRDYDLLLVCLAPANSLNSPNALNAAWALGENVPALLFWDDWQVREVINSWRSLVKKGMTQLQKELRKGDTTARLYRGCTPEEVERYGERVLATFAELLEPWPSRWITLMPRYGWGDETLVTSLLPRCRVYLSVDPTSRIELMPTKAAGDGSIERPREWTLASLMQHDRWIERVKPTWPIHWRGNKNVVKRYGGERLRSELDVQADYDRRWGVLAPPYYHAGSGWFRSRMLYAQNNLNVLFSDSRETSCLGAPYRNYSIASVERLTNAELVELAVAQREAYAPWITSRDHLRSQLTRALEVATSW